MKTTLKIIALCIAFSLATVGCSKEDTLPTQSNSVIYLYDGQQHTALIQSDEDWTLLLDHLFALAEEGYTVQFFNPNARPVANAPKSREVFTTKKKNEAIDWCEQKKSEGYKVTIYYDEDTGIYTCIATK
jgi:hypothetical protein